MDLYVVGRAVGKTTFTLETMYREADWILVVAHAGERERLIKELARRCEEEPPPYSKATPVTGWPLYWRRRICTPGDFHRTRGGIRNPRIAIDNLDMVLHSMFGNVQMATATGILPRRGLPSWPRIKCAVCGGPYDEDNDALGLCADCLAKDENWEDPS